MFKNYLKTALRNLMRQKLFSFINTAGLAIGFSAFILIVLFVRDEFSWDSHWDRGEDIYRLETTIRHEVGSDRLSPSAADPLKQIFLETFPEVEDITRFMDGTLAVREGGTLGTQFTLFVDDNFLDFFNFTFLEGSAATAFNNLNNVVVSQSTAQRYFGNAPALGQVVTARIGGIFRDFVVSAVVEDPPRTTHLRHDFMVPFNREYFVGNRWFTEDWRFLVRDTYIRFTPETNIESIRATLPDIVSQHKPPAYANGQEDGREVLLHLVQLEDSHLKSHVATGDVDVLYGFLSIAFLILLIAVANFLNLTMARTTHRAREVALRKVVGADRLQIVYQFLSEAIILAFLSLMISLVIVELSLPYYNAFLSSFIEVNLISEASVVLGLALLGVSVGLAAGSFQAFYFALLKPRDVLYSNTAADNGTSVLRAGLVIAQFAISVALMTFAFFVNSQTEFARTLDLGFNARDVIILGGTGNDQSETIKQRLLQSPYIKAVGRSSDVPTEGNEDRLLMRPVSGGEKVTLDGLPIGPDFFNAYEIPLLAGRYLEQAEADILRRRGASGTPKTATNIVINASGAALLGFATPEDALNQTIPTDLSANDRIEATIVGVVADFHFDSVRDVIRPGIYYIFEPRQAIMSIRIDPEAREQGIAAIEQAWREVFPEGYFYYRNMADMVDQQYQTDAQLGTVLSAFTFLAIIISCMGLYGLASFTVERRTKEIGLRKVLGANLKDIVGLLLWQFSKPILIANLIAWPVAYYFVSDWLNGYAYRIDLDAMPFILTGLLALVIGWATVAGHAFLVANIKPSKTLRYE